MADLSTNPLEVPPPPENKPVERVKAFARDLAYGAVCGLWEAVVLVYRGRDTSILGYGNPESIYKPLFAKWGDTAPSMNLLISFGFVTATEKPSSQEIRCSLTDRAFELLDSPSIDTGIFISYCRKESSAFALLLRARMKSVGLDPFLDIDIDPGEVWHPYLEEKVKQREYFVVVVGKRTLQSKYVQQEIKWAREAGSRIIPIWHNGFNARSLLKYPDFEDVLGKKNAITVENENAEAYNNAVLKLLNYLGFTLI